MQASFFGRAYQANEHSLDISNSYSIQETGERQYSAAGLPACPLETSVLCQQCTNLLRTLSKYLIRRIFLCMTSKNPSGPMPCTRRVAFSSFHPSLLKCRGNLHFRCAFLICMLLLLCSLTFFLWLSALLYIQYFVHSLVNTEQYRLYAFKILHCPVWSMGRAGS